MMNRSEKKELLKRSKKHFNDHAFWEKLKTAQKAGALLSMLCYYFTIHCKNPKCRLKQRP